MSVWTGAAMALITSLTPALASAPLDRFEAVRVRGVGEDMRAIVGQALRLSPTVRALVAEIERSDVIVYVDWTPRGQARGVTSLMTSRTGTRFLRIRLQPRTSLPDRIPLLAHELQHAVEIARAAGVSDTAALRRMYTRIGTDGQSGHFETPVARRIESAVRQEQAVARSLLRRVLAFTMGGT